MPKTTDAAITAIQLHLLPVQTRVPLKFGHETLTHVTCARSQITLTDRNNNHATGWGETPLNIQWVWPTNLPYQTRLDSILAFLNTLAHTLCNPANHAHPIELTHDLTTHQLPQLIAVHNATHHPTTANQPEEHQLPLLAALLCLSVYDQALHDAFGNLHQIDTYQTYNAHFMNRDLADYLEPEPDSTTTFANQYPADFLNLTPPATLPAWHLVGGLDPLTPADLTAHDIQAPNDNHPVLLTDWITRDQLNCLKLKLRGNDADWDYQRILAVDQLAEKHLDRSTHKTHHLSADFNCTVTDPAYVTNILDRLAADHPATSGRILYVEQPFPYDLAKHNINVSSVSKRKPLFLDESAHDWQHVRLGRRLGWSGVALKTCKTQTGALLSLAFAKAHQMPLMVQDLTNPMLAIIPHAQLAAHAHTIMGIETNATQFYPDASTPEAAIHPSLYRRTKGSINLATLKPPGLGYRIHEIKRELPPPTLTLES